MVRRSFAAAPWLVLFCLFATSVAGAQSPPADEDSVAEDDRSSASPIDDLRLRVEQLERQNQRLIDRLNRMSAEDTPTGSQQEVTNAGYEEDYAAGHSPYRLTQNTVPFEDEPPETDAPPPIEWYEVSSDTKLSASWRNGLEIDSKNKDFRVHIGGRTQLDSSWFDTSPNVNSDPSLANGNMLRDGVDFRRARFRIDGMMYEQYEWAAEFDFVNSALTTSSPTATPTATSVPVPTDLYWTFTKLPWIGNLRIGNQKEAIGFDHMRSSRFLPFMERSFNQDAFYGAFNNGFTPGINAFNHVFDERATWAIGMFKPTNNVFASTTSPGTYSVTGRLTWSPWYVDEGRGLLHLGISARQAGMTAGTARFRTRGPERAGLSQNWPLYADTGNINGDGQQMLNFESSMNIGSLTITAEYLLNRVQGAFRTGGPDVGNLLYSGGYIETMYFLTGEHQEYNRKVGFYERVVPRENAFAVQGPNGPLFGRGAWQVGVRYNYLNLNDKGINGGRLNDVTFGLNWFLNPNMKIQANYSITDRTSVNDGHDGRIQGLGLRLAHDF